ncbi:MAG: hypothetical protein GOU98_04655 [Candidatus Altiarchaeota archaeon]|nr:hypothetical protein [Candidatus Altiarchaeota archaeon]
MKIEILKDTKNPLLSRRQIEFVVTHEGNPTPNKLDVAEHLAAKLNADINLMVIEGYATRFGSNVSPGTCLVYDSTDAMNKAEPLKTLNPKKRVGGERKEEPTKTPEKEGTEVKEKSDTKPEDKSEVTTKNKGEKSETQSKQEE